jgi:hypothetical protein
MDPQWWPAWSPFFNSECAVAAHSWPTLGNRIMSAHNYRTPSKLKEWVNDMPNGELYELAVLDNRTICSSSGRYAHSSGSMSCTWEEFVRGEMHDLVTKTMGEAILAEAISLATSRANDGQLK